MSQLKLQVPVGTGDILPEECAAKRRLEQLIRRELVLSGYEEIETPSFEYYDVFTHDAVQYVQESMIKFFDLKGRILALRPDMTGPIARLAATKCGANGRVLRFCYIGNVYGLKRENSRVEYTQAGVELIGRHGPEADAEVISTAIRAFGTAGLEGFQIDIGQVAFFKGLLESCNLDAEQRERIRTLVDSKNSVELEYELERMGLGCETRDSILELPGLFGGREVFDRARSLAKNEACTRALENLREVYEILCDFGYEQCISLDLGLLNDFNYYSGILFRGIAEGVGIPILSGGRYDNLLCEFGADVPATGFAIGMKELQRVLEKQVKTRQDAMKTTVLRCAPADRAAAYRYAKTLRDAGRRVVLETNGCAYDAQRYEEIVFDGKEGGVC